jgi:hypothetical protein
LSNTGGRPPLRPRFLAAAQSCPGVFDDQFALKLIERGGDVEEQPTSGVPVSILRVGTLSACFFCSRSEVDPENWTGS